MRPGPLRRRAGDPRTRFSGLWLQAAWLPVLLATSYESGAYSGFVFLFGFSKNAFSFRWKVLKSILLEKKV